MAAPSTPAAPGRDCPLCPRLVAYRTELRKGHEEWHNAPVPSFGPLDARLVIVGLAPGLKGANRTGRPFTGDYAGDLLYATLTKCGFATGDFRGGREDGAWSGDTLKLVDTRITNAARCVPPQNKPLPAEIASCRVFLAAELAAMRQARIVLALGRVAHDAVLNALGVKLSSCRFAHAATHTLPAGLILTDSYHCSRYNTSTGRLTPRMFESVLADIRRRLDSSVAAVTSPSRSAG